MTVVPALMISISGGLIVTRTSSDTRLSVDFRKQIFGHAEPLMLASGIVVLLAVLPGIPKLPFLLLGEVIAAKQGLKAGVPIPGKIDDDAVLSAQNIRAASMVNTFIENKVKAAAALPAPGSREEFEKRRARQRPEIMRDLARENGIPIVEDIPLARLLYRRVKVGRCVPMETFKAVAAILAYVYRVLGRNPMRAAAGGAR